MATDPNFLLEVPFLAHVSSQRLAAPPALSSTQAPMFSVGGKSAGVLPCSGLGASDPSATLLWEIENGVAGTLQLAMLGAQPQQLDFDAQLFPSLALVHSSEDPDGSMTVSGLLSTGMLFFHQLAQAGQAAHRTYYLNLSAQLSAHGSPTALAGAGSTVLIGCSDGVVLCVPQAAWREGQGIFELQPSSRGINRLLSGVFYRGQQPAVVALMPFGAARDDRCLVAAVYEDCTLRVFNPAKQQLLISESLAFTPPTAASQQGDAGGGGAAKRPSLTFAAMCSPIATDASGQTEHVVVAAFESASASAARYHALFSLTVSGPGRVALGDRQELSGIGSGATILAATTDGETVWTLVREHGSAHVRGFSRSGQLSKAAMLQEQLRSRAVGERVQDDAVAQELWEDVLASAEASEFSAEQQVLGHVFSPSSLCRHSLRDTLACHGAQLTLSELEACALPGLRTYMQGAVQTLQRRNPHVTPSQSWVLFLHSYRDAWSRRHTVLALHTDPATRQLCCVRSGGLLTLLRPSSAAEALWCSSGASSAPADGNAPRAGGEQRLGQQLLRDPELQAVHACAGAVAAAFGDLALDAFVGLLAAGFATCKALTDAFTSLWLNGPGGTAKRARDDVARSQHSHWRQQRRLLLLQLGQKLGAVRDPVGAVQRYCQALGLTNDPAAGSAPGAAPAPAGGAWSSAVVAAAQQQAYARCSGLRDCLLLLGVMQRLASVGAVALDAAQLARAESGLSPQLEKQLQAAALAYWLTVTPASAGSETSSAGPQVDPAVNALEHLTLGAAAGAAARQATGGRANCASGSVPRSDVALAAQLLPASLAYVGNCDASRVSLAASRLVSWLQSGGRGVAAAPTPLGGHLAPSAGSWVMELGLSLLLRGEHEALLPLSRLAGAGSGCGVSCSSDGGAFLLKGLCVVRQLPRSGAAAVPGQEAAAATKRRNGLVREAADCFFRAASSLSSASKTDLAGAVRALRQIVTGSDSPAATSTADASRPLAALPGPSSAPSSPQPSQQESLLQFFELAMMLFERECAPEGALMLARAALQQLSLLMTHTPEALHPTGWRAHQGRLWSNVFAYCCDLGSYEEAYAAAVANPLPDRALDCQRRLVHELCERAQLRTLCSLPFAGTLTLPATGAAAAAGAPGVVVSLVSEVVAALQRRASNSDLLARPQPYRVLHDFLVVRSDFRGAARAMLALARRLRAEGPAGAAADAIAAYEAAINSLSLVKEADAWLDLSDPWLRMHASPARPPPLLFGSRLTASTDDGAGWEEPVLTLAQVKREYLLLRSAVAASKKLPGVNPLQQWDGDDEVFSQLLLGGEFEAAITLAHASFSGSALTTALERALASLAAHAARLQMREDVTLGHSEGLPGLVQPEQRERLLGQSQLGSRAAPYWVLLSQLLKRYDTARAADGVRLHGGCLRVAAADAVLKVDQRLTLPPWLLQLFQEEPSSASAAAQQGSTGLGPDFSLLGVYLTHDRLADAVALVESCFDTWSRTDPRQRRHHAAVWLPHQRIARLRARLLADGEAGSEQAGALLQRLDAAVQAHLELAAHDSDTDVGKVELMSRSPGMQAAASSVGGTPGSRGGGAWPRFGTPGSIDQDMGFGRHSLDALTPPPPALLWLPPPIESLGG